MRNEGKRGFCGESDEVRLSRAALHMWEEPCISGSEGSGAVFFSGCTLRCVYCQNFHIANSEIGKVVSIMRLSDIFLELQGQGANNINLVTPTHFVPQIIQALDLARQRGMNLPVVYNTSGYEKVDTLRMLEGYVDIYMPDFKYMNSDTAKKYSSAPDYPKVAVSAIKEMFNQVGKCSFDSDGMIKKGVLIRHLILPGNVENTLDVIDWVSGNFNSGDVLFSLMRQYTPPAFDTGFEELSRRVTDEEYEKCEDYMYLAGIEDGFVQDISSAESEYTPPFNLEGVE